MTRPPTRAGTRAVPPGFRYAHALLAACAVLGTLAAAPPATPPWTAAPAAGRPYAYLEGPAGSVLEDTLSVTNPGPRPLTVTLTGDGPAAVAFAARTVTVPARTRADVPFAVTVAAGTPPGEHRGTVRAAAGDRRTAVDLRLKVSGPELAALTVEDARVDRTTGTLHYTLVNRGSTVLDRPRLAVRAEGLLGTRLDLPDRPLPVTLRPGERAARTEPWPDPPALDSVTVRLTATAPGATPATAATGTVFASAPALAGTAAALLAAAGGAAHRLRRRARTKGAPA
ncbi:COG1470 family protein [Streptomyces hydrogenans]|uniref:COG1470 family protein n=1 Tax=Streptomyces hydrogenans TaxID=1873719 RepID=UPI0035DC80EE